MPICYPDTPRRCRECARLIAARAERERTYLAALGNLTAAAAADETEYMSLRDLVERAEIALQLADTEIRRHEFQAVAVGAAQRAFAAAATTHGPTAGAD